MSSIVYKASAVCVNGKNVINPYTGQMVYVPCGRCEACAINKVSRSELKCKIQRSISKYCYLVNLSYAQRYVPKARIIHHKDDIYIMQAIPRERYIWKKKREKRKTIEKRYVVRGLDFSTDYSTVFAASDVYVRNYIDQCDLTVNGKYPWYKNLVPYCCYGDMQLFLKRFRKALYSLIGKYESLHYYVISEYGPVHFRPHFHILLCFDSDEVAQSLGESLRKAWMFGNINFSPERGKSAEYVASYVNSFTRLPYHLRESKDFRPRGRFSNHYGIGFFESSIRNALKGQTDSLLDGINFVDVDKQVKVRPWRSLVDTIYFHYASTPRVTPFQLLDFTRKIRTLFQEISLKYPDVIVDGKPYYYRASRYLYRMLYADDISALSRDLIFDNEFRYLCSIFMWLHIDPDTQIIDDKFKDRFINAFYRCFRYTFIFLRNRGLSSFYNSFRSDLEYDILIAIQDSRNFFSRRDYIMLRDSMDYVERTGMDLVKVFVNPSEYSISLFRKTELYHQAHIKLKERVDMSVKHRELNDLNMKYVEYGTI